MPRHTKPRAAAPAASTAPPDNGFGDLASTTGALAGDRKQLLALLMPAAVVPHHVALHLGQQHMPADLETSAAPTPKSPAEGQAMQAMLGKLLAGGAPQSPAQMQMIQTLLKGRMGQAATKPAIDVTSWIEKKDARCALMHDEMEPQQSTALGALRLTEGDLHLRKITLHSPRVEELDVIQRMVRLQTVIVKDFTLPNLTELLKTLALHCPFVRKVWLYNLPADPHVGKRVRPDWVFWLVRLPQLEDLMLHDVGPHTIRAADHSVNTSLLKHILASAERAATPLNPAETNSSSAVLSCAGPSCTKAGSADDGFKRCSRCKDVSYCGVACQKSGWASHKAHCSPSDAAPDDDVGTSEGRGSTTSIDIRKTMKRLFLCGSLGVDPAVLLPSLLHFPSLRYLRLDEARVQIGHFAQLADAGHSFRFLEFLGLNMLPLFAQTPEFGFQGKVRASAQTFAQLSRVCPRLEELELLGHQILEGSAKPAVSPLSLYLAPETEPQQGGAENPAEDVCSAPPAALNHLEGCFKCLVRFQHGHDLSVPVEVARWLAALPALKTCRFAVGTPDRGFISALSKSATLADVELGFRQLESEDELLDMRSMRQLRRLKFSANSHTDTRREIVTDELAATLRGCEVIVDNVAVDSTEARVRMERRNDEALKGRGGKKSQRSRRS